ncbi:MAG: protein kinase [Planctomycetes bacterium]|nr:protein kinase [Planctomycetota bacterium]
MTSDSPFGLLFGVAAVRRGWVTEAQVLECMEEQRQALAIGYQEPLGELLIRRGHLDVGQVARILKAQAITEKIQEDLLYGKIALKNGFVTKDQLAECLEEQRGRRYAVGLGTLLQDRGYLDREAHEAVKAAQARVIERAGAQPPTRKLAQGAPPTTRQLRRTLFGEVALRERLVSPAQLEDALEVQRRMREMGIQKRLGEVLVEKRILAADQVDRVVRILGRMKAGVEIPGFRIEERLGQGSMGVVYRGWQESLQRPVAIKLLRPSLASNTAFVERFRREAVLAARLSHPNIVTIHDVGQAMGVPYLVMEFVAGESLARRLERVIVLEEREALGHAIGVARALKAAAAAGIVHRDVKPENVLVTADGTPKLCDLGVARLSGDAPKAHGGVAGTPYYMAPEAARGDADVDGRADIYSLGVTLFHMVTGRVPFPGPNPAQVMAAHLVKRVPYARDLNVTLSVTAANVIARATERERERRYQGPDDLLEDLETALRRLERPADGAAPAPAEAPARGRRASRTTKARRRPR